MFEEGVRGFLYEWSRDGRYAVGSGGGDLWYASTGENSGTLERHAFLADEFDALSPDISPDGRFLVYQSNESGRYEVYVQPFPDGGRKWLISTNGGAAPRWRGDGKEIFYVEEGAMTAVSVSTTPTFSVGSAERLFDGDGALDGGRGHRYDVTPDGQRFIVAEPLEGAGRTIHVVQNWYEEFRGGAQK